MDKQTALVITSISAPNRALKDYATGCQKKHWDYIVVGDDASPDRFNLSGCDFWSLDRQLTLDFRLAQVLPEKHYARKNLGYLIAKSRGAEIIVETDDDNCPYDGFWQQRKLIHDADYLEDVGWINVYRFFSDHMIWPRGFPLEQLHSSQTANHERQFGLRCPIQQGLADKNPDVDAIYRLVMPLPQHFSRRNPVALGRGAWSPFNSQNTTWFKEAFALLYLPSYCSFRMCDIWRSFVALRICWVNNWKTLFHHATVYQDRNEHNLMRDFKDEIDGYLYNAAICDELAKLELEAGAEHVANNLRKCYALLVRMGLIPEKELELLDCWLLDMMGFGL